MHYQKDPQILYLSQGHSVLSPKINIASDSRLLANYPF